MSKHQKRLRDLAATADLDVPPDNYTIHPNHAEIARLAYDLWQRRGCPVGSPEEDWRVAEAELQHSHALQLGK